MLPLILSALACAPCGGDAPCEIEGGYYMAFPPAGRGPWPVVVYPHGAGSRPESYAGNGAMLEVFHAAGVMLILPAGEGEVWNAWLAPDRRDDLAFFDDVLAHAEGIWAIDASRVIASGFSLGGSMAHLAACYRPDVYAAAAPMSGTFWEPFPGDCADAPMRLRHTHGTSDGTWTMEGRSWGAAKQGAVEDAAAFWAAQNGCSGETTAEVEGPVTCTVWRGCDVETRLCLHGEGHDRIDGWEQRLIDWAL